MLFGKKKETLGAQETVAADSASDQPSGYVQNVDNSGAEKSYLASLLPAFACGAGLFSDGYINSVIGPVNTILGKIYDDAFSKSSGQKNVSSIAFAGTVLGMLIFGVTSDKWSRTGSLMVSTVILAVFAALAAGSYGGGSLHGMITALTIYRFFVGVGIGGEYPAGSVACSEATGELKEGTRNRWFIMFTNVAIDWGFVIGTFVPYLMVVICGTDHLRAAWRIALGLGVVCPVLLLFARMRLKEPEEFTKESMKHVKIPYWLVIKYYWKRLIVVSAIWFIYDFSTYSFGIFSSTILANIYDSSAPLTQSLGWNVVINLFYIPGAMLGSIYSDWLGPKYALASGAIAQAVVGFFMAGFYPKLAIPSNVGGFAVIYGIFLSLGEIGAGDNIGLVASKTCATGVRGQYYAIAAAIGKIGAFVGTYIFPYIEAAGGDDANASAQIPFYVSSAGCVLMALLVLFFVPSIGQDTITNEDVKFREYLTANSWDVSQMGTTPSIENGVVSVGSTKEMDQKL